MLSVSNSFKRKLYNDERDYSCRARITLANNQELTVQNDYIMSNGFEIEGAVSEDNSFNALGSTVIGSAQLILYNNDEIYSDYDFKNAKVALYVSLNVEAIVNDQEVIIPEELKLGEFTVDNATYGSSTITLSMLDNMEKFDRPYSLSTLAYPATLEEIVQDACATYNCDVTLAPSSANFPNKEYIVSTRPSDDDTTFRDVLGYVATLAGCFAKCDTEGRLEIKWFDIEALENPGNTLDGGTFNPWTAGTNTNGGTFNPWTAGTTIDGGAFTDSRIPHHINTLYSQNIGVDDVVITGVKIIIELDSDAEEDTKTYSAGTDDYEIVVEGNPFITESNAQTVLDYLSAQLIGLTFRKCDVTHANDPTIEAGDVGLLWDSKGVEHPILITRTDFSPKAPQTIVCGAETPSRNNATRFSSQTKAFVDTRKQLRKQRTNYEQALDDLKEDIEREAKGLYCTQEVQEDGSTITYLHDRPTLAESQIRIKVSTVGITVTPNGGRTWYGLTVNGELLASVIQTMNLFFDYAHGGTLTLGGNRYGTNELRVYNSSNKELAYLGPGGVTFHYEDQYFPNAAESDWLNGIVALGDYNGWRRPAIVVYNNEDDDDHAEWEVVTNYMSQGTSSQTLNKYAIICGRANNSASSLPSDASVYELLYGYQRQAYISFFRTDAFISGTSDSEYLGSGGYQVLISGKTDIASNTRFRGSVLVKQNLTVSGTKSRTVETSDYGDRLLYCYEMAAPVFGDFGSGEIDEDGFCYVEIDDILRETIANLEYRVFLTKEGQGDIWIEEKNNNYFVVKGTPNLKFAWELKAVQRDYETVRIENPGLYNVQLEETDLENIYDQDLEEFIKEKENIYEVA